MAAGRSPLVMALALRCPVPAVPRDLAWAGDGRSIRLIVPNSPGPSIDMIARVMDHRQSKSRGKPVVVESLLGAAGVRETQESVRAPKEDSTVGIAPYSHVIIPSIYMDLSCNASREVTSISILEGSLKVLAISSNLRVANRKKLIALAEAQSGTLNFRSAGNGSISHRARAFLASKAGVKPNHVPHNAIARGN
jgi:tripartite-type tricarboxylate transporter receptor subunit TctC